MPYELFKLVSLEEQSGMSNTVREKNKYMPMVVIHVLGLLRDLCKTMRMW